MRLYLSCVVVGILLTIKCRAETPKILPECTLAEPGFFKQGECDVRYQCKADYPSETRNYQRPPGYPMPREGEEPWGWTDALPRSFAAPVIDSRDLVEDDPWATDEFMLWALLDDALMNCSSVEDTRARALCETRAEILENGNINDLVVPADKGHSVDARDPKDIVRQRAERPTCEDPVPEPSSLIGPPEHPPQVVAECCQFTFECAQWMNLEIRPRWAARGQQNVQFDNDDEWAKWACCKARMTQTCPSIKCFGPDWRTVFPPGCANPKDSIPMGTVGLPSGHGRVPRLGTSPEVKGWI